MNRSRPNVAVVGAGLAGLAAAWTLSRRGFDVVVLEREAHAGGRARSEKRDGFTLDAVGPLISTGDRRLLGWIHELDLRDESLPLRPVLTMLANAQSLAPIETINPFRIARMPGVRRLQGLRLIRLPRLIRRYADHLSPDHPEAAAPLDDRSLGDFGRLYFGPSVLSHWLAPFVNQTSLGNANDTSRALFLRRHLTHAIARPGLLRSGIGELAETAAAKLAVTQSADVVGIDCTADRRCVVRFRSDSGDRLLTVAAVVVAVPAAEAARLAAPALVTAEVEGLRSIAYRPAVTLALGLRRPFHPHPQNIQLPHREGEPLESVLFEPGVRGGRVPNGRGLAIARATAEASRALLNASDDVVRKDLATSLKRIHPGIESASQFAHVFRVERAEPCFQVGHYRAIANFERVQRELRSEGRRLYFAGDYLMDPSIEGAIASAQRAAAAVEADCG